MKIENVMSPDAFALGKLPWQFFCTLTFRNQVLRRSSGAIQRKILFAFVREVAHFGGIHFHCLLWCCRLESGEVGGNLHHHVLVGGLPKSIVGTWGCLQMMNIACNRGYGITRVRVYNPDLDGVGYVLKNVGRGHEGNVYELTKFGASEVTLSRSVAMRIARGDYRGDTSSSNAQEAAGSRSEKQRVGRGEVLVSNVPGFGFPADVTNTHVMSVIRSTDDGLFFLR